MAQITIRKDNIAPSITINEPNNAEEFDITPIFDITIDETNLDEFWYTIDDGANNYTITELVGTIDSGAWSAAPSGTITIRFYARDLAGNIGTRFVIIVKTSSPSQPPPEIPGYNLFLVIGVISIISLILIRRRFKT